MQIELPADGHALAEPLSVYGGDRLRLIAHSLTQKETICASIGHLSNVAIVPAGGGMMSHLSAWENLVLPVWYHDTGALKALEAWLEMVMRHCEVDAATIERLKHSMPGELTPFEKALAAFLRAMVAEPDLILFENLLDGMAARDVARIIQFEDVFHLFFPFRASLRVLFTLSPTGEQPM